MEELFEVMGYSAVNCQWLMIVVAAAPEKRFLTLRVMNSEIPTCA
jgi:hypothetical protein